MRRARKEATMERAPGGAEPGRDPGQGEEAFTRLLREGRRPRGETPGPGAASGRDRRGVFVARVLSAGAEGDVVVEWRGARGPEVRGARRLQVADELRPGAIVALVFEDGDEDRAIVLGPLHGMGDAAGLAEGDRPQVRVAGRAIVLDAEDEVILRCGPATVHLKKDGTVAIRGAKLLSRASGVNRIKGGAVQIN